MPISMLLFIGTDVTVVEKSTANHLICFVSFRTINFPPSSRMPFLRTARRGRRLSAGSYSPARLSAVGAHVTTRNPCSTESHSV
jgi:hypothetical protein